MNRVLKYTFLGLSAIILIVTLFTFWAINQLKNSEAYQVAIKQIGSMPIIQKATGEVEGYGWYVEGFVKENSLIDSASFLLTVKGKRENIDILCLMGKDENKQWIVKEYKIL